MYSIQLGTNVHIGYYDQEHHVLHQEKTIFDEISDDYPTLTNTEIRNVLAAFLFTGEDVYKLIGDLSGGERGRVSLAKLMLSEANFLILDEPTNHLDIALFTGEDVYKLIGDLSGGERGRVSLAKLMLSEANFLILDEPTNHLDIASKEILEKALNDYTGTILYVSHDRYFINQTAQRILELTNHTFVNYIGNYDYYVEKKEELTKIYAPSDENPSHIPETISETKLDWQAQKEAQARERKRKNEFQKTEKRIDALETRNTEIDELMTREDIYTNSVKCRELAEEKSAIEEELLKLYEIWETLAEELS